MIRRGNHLDEDDAAPQLPIVENRQPRELVKTGKLLTSPPLPDLGAKVSLQMLLGALAG